MESAPVPVKGRLDGGSRKSGRSRVRARTNGQLRTIAAVQFACCQKLALVVAWAMGASLSIECCCEHNPKACVKTLGAQACRHWPGSKVSQFTGTNYWGKHQIMPPIVNRRMWILLFPVNLKD